MLEVGILYVDKFPAADPSPNVAILLRMEAIDPDDGILYAYELTDDWKPISETANFRLDGVLTLTVTSERGNRQALKSLEWSRQNNDTVVARNTAWWGEDNYAIGLMPDGRYFTTSWPDNDEKIVTRSIIDGALRVPIMARRAFPPQAAVTVFIGFYLEPALWTQALAVFEARMF